MTLNNFLNLGSNIECVSVHQLPYKHGNHCYAKTYFEETHPEEMKESEIFREIKNFQVDSFSIIGGGMYPVELCIYLKGSGNV